MTKRFLIKYTRDPATGSVEDWHRAVEAFIAGIDADPVLGGRIAYRCMKARDGEAYYHLAEPADDEAAKVLNEQAWFKRYTEETRRVGGGRVEVVPLETIAETRKR
ncbi:MAG TPA: hypothetical protein VHJ20_01695 [Polyangia bacterium]|nr:hypothetical protein [Polyangia bacterium]